MGIIDLLLSCLGPAATGIGLPQLLAAACAIALGYVVFGMTGFGSAIVAMPFLTQVMPLQRAVVTMLACDIAAGLLLGMGNRAAVSRPELRRLIPWMLLGMALGVALLLRAPERPLRMLLGGGVLLYSLWRLCASPKPFSPWSAAWAVPFGIAGGGFTGMFGTGGPLYTIYLSGRLENLNQLRATVATLIMITGAARLAMFAVTGLLLHWEAIALAAWMIPCSVAGMRAGGWLRLRVPPAFVTRLLWWVLLAGGASLLARAALA
jgi:uncharacterized membrane protein YfcA